MPLVRPGRTLLVAIAVVMFVLLLVAITRGRLLSAANLREIGLDAGPLLLAAAGMALVMGAGEVDLSVGAQLALTTGIAVSLGTRGGASVAVVAPVVLATGALLGGLNGALVGAARLPSLLVTLATMLLYRHGLRWWSRGADAVATPGWTALAGGGRWVLVVLAAAVIFAAVVWALRTGRARRALAAGAASLDADRWRDPREGSPPLAVLGPFVALGALTGAAAILGLYRALPRLSLEATGSGFELEVIAVVVFASLLAGRERPTDGALAAAAILLAAIGTALAALGVMPGWEQALHGAIVAAGAAAYAWRGRRAREAARAAS